MKAGTHPRWSQWMWCYSLYSSKFQHWLVQTIEKTPLSSNFNFVTIPFKVLFMSSAAPLPATLLLPFFFLWMFCTDQLHVHIFSAHCIISIKTVGLKPGSERGRWFCDECAQLYNGKVPQFRSFVPNFLSQTFHNVTVWRYFPGLVLSLDAMPSKFHSSTEDCLSLEGTAYHQWWSSTWRLSLTPILLTAQIWGPWKSQKCNDTKDFDSD